jgi:hypothetical protein
MRVLPCITNQHTVCPLNQRTPCRNLPLCTSSRGRLSGQRLGLMAMGMDEALPLCCPMK